MHFVDRVLSCAYKYIYIFYRKRIDIHYYMYFSFHLLIQTILRKLIKKYFQIQSNVATFT